MSGFRFTTAGESHGPGLVAIVEGMPAGLELDREALDARHGAAPARPRPRRPDEDRDRHGRDPLGRAPRPHARQPDRRPRRQPRLRQLGGADEPVAGRRRGRRGPPAAPRPRRPGRRPEVRPQRHSQRARAGQRPRDRRPRRRRLDRPRLPHRARRQRAQPRHPDRLGARRPSATTSAPDDFAGVDDDPVRCLDPEASAAMVDEINRLRKANESLGGTFEVRAFGLVPGLGSHISWEDRLDGRLAGAVASIQSVKGVSIGEAWDVAGRPGSEAHDEIFWSEERGYYRETNHAGGLEGGMTNGLPLSVRAAIKPISTLTKPLRSVDTETQGAGPGAARAHRLDRRAGRRRGRRGDGLPRPRPHLPREVRRRSHRRRPRRGRAPTRSASTSADEPSLFRLRDG